MADNTVLPAGGAGDTIAADDIAGVKYQRVKLIFGADGVNSGDVSTSNMLPVQVLAQATSIAKAEDAAHASGDVGVPALAVQKLTPANLAGTDADYEPLQISNGRLYTASNVKVRVQVIPTISSGAIYATADQLGGLMTIANAARKSGGSGMLRAVTILENGGAQRANIDLVFFDRSVTLAADNAAFAVSDADMAFCLGVVSITSYNTAWAAAGNAIATLKGIDLPFVLNATSLYCAAVVRGTPTYTSTSDLTFSFVIDQD